MHQFLEKDYGALENHFGLLTSDKQSIDTEEFRGFIEPTGMSIGELSKSMGLSRTSLYSKKLKLSKKDISSRIIPFVIAADLAFELFNDEAKAKAWLLTPNTIFFGKSPFQVSLLGDGKAVIDQLLTWLGKKDGQVM